MFSAYKLDPGKAVYKHLHVGRDAVGMQLGCSWDAVGMQLGCSWDGMQLGCSRDAVRCMISEVVVLSFHFTCVFMAPYE